MTNGLPHDDVPSNIDPPAFGRLTEEETCAIEWTRGIWRRRGVAAQLIVGTTERGEDYITLSFSNMEESFEHLCRDETGQWVRTAWPTEELRGRSPSLRSLLTMALVGQSIGVIDHG